MYKHQVLFQPEELNLLMCGTFCLSFKVSSSFIELYFPLFRGCWPILCHVWGDHMSPQWDSLTCTSVGTYTLIQCLISVGEELGGKTLLVCVCEVTFTARILCFRYIFAFLFVVCLFLSGFNILFVLEVAFTCLWVFLCACLRV